MTKKGSTTTKKDSTRMMQLESSPSCLRNQVALLQLVAIVIAGHVFRNGQRARQSRLATTHATAIQNAKVLASGPGKGARGIAHCLVRLAVAMAVAARSLL